MSHRGTDYARLVLLAALTAVFGSAVLRESVQAQPAPHHPGRWTTADPWPGRVVYDTSVQAVHMALVRGDTLFARPHSQVLAWGNWSASVPTGGGLWGWNLTTDVPAQALSNLTRLAVTVPPYDLFCAGHSSLPSGDLLIVSGTERGKTGTNQSARFNTSSRNWTSAQMNGRRWYANATPLANGKLLATAGNAGHHMVVFGGQSKNGTDPAVLVNDVKRYRITLDGEPDLALVDDGIGSDWPAPREFHTLTDKENGPYYLFGGKDAGGQTRRDVWQLRQRDNDYMESYVWHELPVSNPTDISTRWRHAAIVVPTDGDSSTMYVHGGERITSTTTTPLGDLWRLKWETTPAPGWRWKEMTDSATGDVPPGPRYGHSMIWDPDNNRAIMYGGRVSGAINDTNLYVLTFPGGVPTWKIAPRIGATMPAARTRHAMAMNPKPTQLSTGIVFGGETAFGLSDTLWEFTLSGPAAAPSVTWSRRDPASGTSPSARADATIVGYEEFPTSYIVLGGELANGAWDPVAWEFRFAGTGSMWHQLVPPSPALRGHRSIVESRLLTPLQAERFNPDSNTWMPYGPLKKRQSYHMMFAASDGKLYSPGPTAGLGQGWRDSTWRFDPATETWALYALNNTTPMPSTISGMLYRPDYVMKCGGLFTTFEQGGATKSLQTGLSTSPSLPTWRASANALQYARTDHILTMLPTGEVLASGGEGSTDADDPDPNDDLPRRRPEIWDPDYSIGGFGYWYGAVTGAPNTLDSELVTRGHHSSAVLLPDGRLLSGGGWDKHPNSTKRSVSQFSPPYLFEPASAGGAAAVRPQLLGTQDHIPYGQTFKVACSDPIVAACLIRPGASTHSFTQDTRYIPLAISQPAGSHQVTADALTANVAPPGNYLLFVLRNDNGRKVPSIARWVNVGSSLPVYSTWDIVPPTTITNLSVLNNTGTSLTLQWTAPYDDSLGTSAKAKRYEVRYRAANGLSNWNEFIDIGRPVGGLPPPGNVNEVQTVNVSGLSPDTLYYFRIVSRDGAGSDRNWSALSNQAETPSGGGCPFVDTRTASGWEVENSILGRSLSGAMALDGYRLRFTPQVVNGRVQLRVRENEQEVTTLDQLRLIAVDHAPGVRAYSLGDRVVLGSRAPASRVTTNEGMDITALVNGMGEGFRGGPGDTLLVEFSGEAASAAQALSADATTSHDPFLEGDGGKCPPDCSPLRSPDIFSATGVDALVLSQSGIRIQAQGFSGEWQTVATRYPREYLDEVALEEVGHGPLRIVFVGRHTVHFLGRLESGGGEFTARKLPLLAAGHTRFGDVAAAVDSIGNLTTQLAPGDTVSLEFGWEPVAEGQVRELLLLSHGVYTANLPAKQQESPPAEFSIQSWRPNPFAGSAVLRFALPKGQLVRLQILDAQGRRVRQLANHSLPAGAHALEWDGRNEAGTRVGAGVYFYQFVAGEHRVNGRVALVP